MVRITNEVRPIETINRADTAVTGGARAPAPVVAQPTSASDLKTLAAGRAGLTGAADIDSERVAKIKAALEAGELAFDAAAVATHICSFHRRGE
ncbi:flagellar biosynthesis anti-sigma factor FlgM [Burkholderia dolosa]|uniref:flagellar biosynthesis anti-sigma factor FlgM n=1 Tax=Burkholderia dolosa TaxID=152500 RepID=UPI001B92B2CA|nr:flagellar biosynthesis anti-sigma factor FlgM [Burkholderia dolosa]MBR8313176.1 flagellar biosynthesis anti-sigma factor FlgM [Burkholderia dolosa]